jgi:2'-5' RNA ligase
MNSELTTQYSNLWESNLPRVSAGKIEIDTCLSNPVTDLRRGLTLLFRPSPKTTLSIAGFLEEIRDLEPEQYFYPAADLHFTVLSLFTASIDHQAGYAAIPEYRAFVQQALEDMPAFSLQLKGISLTTGAVIVCGYPDSEVLNLIRTKLRELLACGNLGSGMEKRYTLTMAHSTILRFSAPLRNPPVFVKMLSENRARSFGTIIVSEVHLVKNDWYMRHQNLEIETVFPLS